jgi:serine/threonine-protein kinase
MKAAKKEGGIPAPIAVRIVMQACGGLHAAHELKNDKSELVGLVHRDVSPQNILVTYEGVAKVVDFGVAKATAMGDGATQAGQIKGKIGYMAPEQVKGEQLDRRVDVFALGIVLYALTTGKHPFRRESEAATMYNICAPQPVIPPRKIKADFPQKLEEALLTALEKDPSKRFATANDFLKALDRALPSELRTTDEDVAAYVMRLFGERREEQKRALAQALERADQAAISQTSVRSLMNDAVVAPVQMPISQISLTTSPISAGSFTDGELSSSHLNVSKTGAEAAPKRRGLVFAAAIVVVLAVAVVITASIRSRNAIATAPAATHPAKVAETPSPAAQPPASSAQRTQNVEDMPMEPTAVAVPKSEVDATNTATASRSRGGGRAQQKAAPAKADPPPAASAAAVPPKSTGSSGTSTKSKVQWTNPGF